MEKPKPPVQAMKYLNVVYFAEKHEESHKVQLTSDISMLSDVYEAIMRNKAKRRQSPLVKVEVVFVATGVVKELPLDFLIGSLPRSLFVLNFLEVKELKETIPHSKRVITEEQLLKFDISDGIMLFAPFVEYEETFQAAVSKSICSLLLKQLYGKYRVQAALPCSFLEQVSMLSVCDPLFNGLTARPEICQNGCVYLLGNEFSCIAALGYVFKEEILFRAAIPIFNNSIGWELISEQYNSQGALQNEDYALYKACFCGFEIKIKAEEGNIFGFFAAAQGIAHSMFPIMPRQTNFEQHLISIRDICKPIDEVLASWRLTSELFEEFIKDTQISIEECDNYSMKSLLLRYTMQTCEEESSTLCAVPSHFLCAPEEIRDNIIEQICDSFINQDDNSLHNALADIFESMLPVMHQIRKSSVAWIFSGTSSAIADARMRYYTNIITKYEQEHVYLAPALTAMQESQTKYPAKEGVFVVLLILNSFGEYLPQYSEYQLLLQSICTNDALFELYESDVRLFLQFAPIFEMWKMEDLQGALSGNPVLFKIAAAMYNFRRLQNVFIDYVSDIISFAQANLIFAVSHQDFGRGQPIEGLWWFYSKLLGECHSNLAAFLLSVGRVNTSRNLRPATLNEQVGHDLAIKELIYIEQHDKALLGSLMKLYINNRLLDGTNPRISSNEIVMMSRAFDKTIDYASFNISRIKFSSALDIDEAFETLYDELCDINYLLPDWEFDVVQCNEELSEGSAGQQIIFNSVKFHSEYCIIEGLATQKFNCSLNRLLSQEIPETTRISRNETIKREIVQNVEIIKDCLCSFVPFFDYLGTQSSEGNETLEQRRLIDKMQYHLQYEKIRVKRLITDLVDCREQRYSHYNITVAGCLTELLLASEEAQLVQRALGAALEPEFKFDLNGFLHEIISD